MHAHDDTKNEIKRCSNSLPKAMFLKFRIVKLSLLSEKYDADITGKNGFI